MTRLERLSHASQIISAIAVVVSIVHLLAQIEEHGGLLDGQPFLDDLLDSG